MDTETSFSPGLKGVIANETGISLLDETNEKIIIRGHDLIELSGDQTYAEMIHLLIEGSLPDESGKGQLEEKLKAHYNVPDTVLEVLKKLPKNTHPMDAQRTALSILAGYDEKLDDRSTSTNKDRAYQLLGQLPAITAMSYRILQGQEPVKPDPSLSYSANFLYMITGEKPSELQTKIFDRSLLLYSEHEMPNSTFTSRVIASTNADMYGALTGAVASLKGNLHGGANEAVMHMLNEVDSPSGFELLMQTKLKKKEKIMGFGHRVYMNKMDPRARAMKESLQLLCQEKGDNSLLEMCEAGESVMQEEKGLYPNLDYYAAPVYWMLGIPIPLYTPIFFSSRAAGLCAHIIEQHDNNRLFRPRVKYVGKALD